MADITIPYLLANGPGNIVDATQLNANFSTIYTAFNSNIDNTNVGPAGFFASQMLPTTSGQATFGGALPYVFPAGITAGGPISATTGTFSGTITSGNVTSSGTVSAVLTSTGAVTAASGIIADQAFALGQISLNNGTSNLVLFSTTGGVAAPAYTTRSAGTKIVLYPNLSASTTDFAIGISGGTLWNSVPTASSQFQWFAGTAPIATLSGAGGLVLTGQLSATTAVISGGLNANWLETSSGIIYTNSAGSRYIQDNGSQFGFTGPIAATGYSGGPMSGTTGFFTGGVTAGSFTGGPFSGSSLTLSGGITVGASNGTINASTDHLFLQATTGTSIVNDSNSAYAPLLAGTGSFTGAVTGAGFAGGAHSGTTGTFTSGLTAPSLGTTGTLQLTGANASGSGVLINTSTAGQSSAAFQTAGTFTAYVTAGGVFTTYSDARLKTNVVTIDSGLVKIAALRPVSFDLNSTGERGLGFIAQEVLPIVPEAVSQNEADGMYGVAYTTLIPVLVRAIQEQQAQIDALRAAMHL